MKLSCEITKSQKLVQQMYSLGLEEGICGTRPAASLQSYAHLDFPAGGGLLDVLSAPLHDFTPKKFAIVAVGFVALAGLVMIAWGATHHRESEF